MEIKTPLIKDVHGLGDMVAAATAAVGIKPCGGCKKRADALNSMMQFAPRESTWTVPPNVPEGWEREAAYEVEGRRVELFHHTNGKLLIWHVVDGQYKNSHTFCCGDRMRSVMQLKWDELCRLL